MNIEAGKKYRTRDGEETEPLEATGDSRFPFRGCIRSQWYVWRADGRHCGLDNCHLDLIAEIPDEPEAGEKCYFVSGGHIDYMTLADAEKCAAELAEEAAPGVTFSVAKVIKSCTASVRVEWSDGKENS